MPAKTITPKLFTARRITLGCMLTKTIIFVFLPVKTITLKLVAAKNNTVQCVVAKTIILAFVPANKNYFSKLIYYLKNYSHSTSLGIEFYVFFRFLWCSQFLCFFLSIFRFFSIFMLFLIFMVFSIFMVYIP